MSMELTGDIVLKIKHHTVQDQIFSFKSGFISTYETAFEMNVNQIVNPLSGPMRNIGNDFNGIGKTISINGVLYDESESVVSNNTIKTIKQMKYWLESLTSGFQIRPCEFNSTEDEYSLSTGSQTTVIEGVEIPGSWEKTKGYIINLTFGDTNESQGVMMKTFSLTLWVAGS